MNVAARWSQHSPMLGQWASSHTVWSFRSLRRSRTPTNVAPPGAFTLSHGGFRASARGSTARRAAREVIWTSGSGVAIARRKIAPGRGGNQTASTVWLIGSVALGSRPGTATRRDLLGPRPAAHLFQL